MQCLYLVQSAIMTGSPSLILQAADIALSMKHRSAKLDFASIAVLHQDQKINYAKTSLKSTD